MLIQIIACCLFGIKPLSEPMMTWALTNKYYSQWLVQSRAMSRRFESKHCVHMDRNCTRNILLLLRLIGSKGNHKNIFYIQNAIELRINHMCLTFFYFLQHWSIVSPPWTDGGMLSCHKEVDILQTSFSNAPSWMLEFHICFTKVSPELTIPQHRLKL